MANVCCVISRNFLKIIVILFLKIRENGKNVCCCVISRKFSKNCHVIFYFFFVKSHTYSIFETFKSFLKRLTCGEDIIIPFINGSIRCKEAKFMRSSDGSILAFLLIRNINLKPNFVMIYFRSLLNRENDELCLSFLSLRQFRSENAQR